MGCEIDKLGSNNDDIEYHIKELKRINNNIKKGITELKKKISNINDNEGTCLRVVFRL